MMPDEADRQLEEFHKKKGQFAKEQFNATQVIQDEVDKLWTYAQQLGFKTLADFLRFAFKRWDLEQDKSMARNWFETYLQHVQNRTSKEPYSIGVWGPGSTFIEYLHYQEKEAVSRLDELHWLLDAQKPSFDRFTAVLPEMKNVPAKVGEPLDRETFELYEEFIRRSIELMKKLLSNPDAIDNYLEQS
jgi:hypothetical protein